MPIVATRTGELISAPILTPEQKNKLWETVVRNWAQAHPEAFQDVPHPSSANKSQE